MRAWVGTVPFLLLFVGLAFTRLKSFVVAALVLFVTLALSIGFWRVASRQLAESCLEGAVTAFIPIIWVVFGAVYSYTVSVESRGMEVIQQRLAALTDDQRIQAVLVSFCFGGFLEAIAGFGTAVAIPSAMLIGFGFGAVPAVTISLVANSVPVAFGALGIPVIALARVTQLSVVDLTRLVAIQLLPFAILIPFAIAWIANRALGQKRELRSILPDIMVIGVAFSMIQMLIAYTLGPELVAVGGSIGGFGAYLFYRKFRPVSVTARERGGSLLSASRIYLVLLALVILSRFAGEALKQPPFALLLPLGEHGVNIDWLATPGTLLVIATLIGGRWCAVSWARLGRLARETAHRIRYSALTIVLILMIAKSMSVSGMIVAVASGLGSFLKSAYPILSPLIGALGTFVTGSDTSSNVLLGELQKQTALKTGFSPEWLAAANTSGATAGKMISPQSIQIAASVVGVEPQQGKILRQNFKYCVLYLAIAGLYIALVAWL